MGTRNRGRALWRAVSSFWQIEQLENRLLLSGTPFITGNNPIQAGAAYTLNLHPDGVAFAHWVVNWGDGTQTTVPVADATYQHAFQLASAGLHISAVAELANNTPVATADLAGSLGNVGHLTIQASGPVATTPNGDILVLVNGDGLEEFDPSGNPVTTFGNNGIAQLPVNGDNIPFTAYDVAVASDGQIAVATEWYNWCIADYDPNGDLDELFFYADDYATTTGFEVNGDTATLVGTDEFTVMNGGTYHYYYNMTATADLDTDAKTQTFTPRNPTDPPPTIAWYNSITLPNGNSLSTDSNFNTLTESHGDGTPEPFGPSGSVALNMNDSNPNGAPSLAILPNGDYEVAADGSDGVDVVDVLPYSIVAVSPAAPAISINTIPSATEASPVTITANVTPHGYAGDNLTYEWTLVDPSDPTNPVVIGTPDPSLTFTPDAGGTWSASLTVTDTDQSLSTTTNPQSFSVGYLTPTVETSAAADASTVTGTSVGLSAFGSLSDGYDSNLTYTWSAISIPSPDGTVDFSDSGDNSAAYTVASFSEAGTYELEVSIADGSSSVTSDAYVTVQQTPTILEVSGGNSFVPSQMSAGILDQFGNPIDVSPTAFTWFVSDDSIATIDSNGLLTPLGKEGTVSVEARGDGLVGETSLSLAFNSYGIEFNGNAYGNATYAGESAATLYEGDDALFSSTGAAPTIRASDGLPFTQYYRLGAGLPEPTAPIYADFPFPVQGISFDLYSFNGADDASGTEEAQVRVFENGQTTPTATVEVYGDGKADAPGYPYAADAINVNLNYSNVTRIEIVESNHTEVPEPGHAPTDLGMEINNLELTPSRQLVSLTAFRTGENFGEPVSRALQEGGDPSNYVVLVNDNFDQQLPGGAPDDSADTAPILEGNEMDRVGGGTVTVGDLPGDAPVDPDFGRIQLNLTEAAMLAGGTVQLTLSDPTAVKLFNGNVLGGEELTNLSDLSINLSSPSGSELQSLDGGSMDIWFEALKATADFSFTVTYTSPANVVSTDSIQMQFIDWQFVGTNGQQMSAAEPVWQDALVAAATAPDGALEDPTGADGIDASSDFFKTEITGLSTSSPMQIQITSDDDPADTYTETLQSVDGALVQPDYTVLYNDDTDLPTDSAPLTAEEDSEIQSGLGLDAVHNKDVNVRLIVSNDEFKRGMASIQQPEFVFTNDVINAGGHIQGELSLPQEWRGYDVFIETNSETNSRAFFGPVTDTNDLVPFNFIESNLGYVTLTAVTSPDATRDTIHELGNSAVVNVLPAGQSVDVWSNSYAGQAWDALHIKTFSGSNGFVEGDPIARNRIITDLYARLFDSGYNSANPTALNPYEWFGIAAFVSANAGNGMTEAQSYDFTPAILGIPDANRTQYYLGLGNLSVFEDMYAQGLAYQADGLTAVNTIVGTDQGRTLQQQGWTAISNAMTEPNLTGAQRQADIVSGVESIADYEQTVTLQSVIDQDTSDFAAATNTLPNYWYPVKSGVPGDTLTFKQWCTSSAGAAIVGPNYSFAIGADRYDWFVNDIFINWQAWRETNYYINVKTLLTGGYT